MSPDIEPSWKERLEEEFQAPYFAQLKHFLVTEVKERTIYPAGRDMFNAFRSTPFQEVKVVILGQDPYHGPGQAHGLCFSVPKGIALPPSLRNIFQELSKDLGVPPPSHGDLTAWAAQGVLLLNTILSVRAHEPGSHQGKGWEAFTDAALTQLSRHHSGLVFLLWGRHAQEKENIIDKDKHYVLKAPHPSPLSAHRGFMGCGHFSATNELLLAQGRTPIQWALP